MRARGVIFVLVVSLSGCPDPGATQPSAKTTAKTGFTPTSGGLGPNAKPRRGTLPVFEAVRVEGGKFTMGSGGSTQGGRDDERPRAERAVEAFGIDRCEVTNAQYRLFLASPDSKEHVFCHPDEPPNKGHRPSKPSGKERAWGSVLDPFEGKGRESHPVVLIDWWDAYAFASWVGRRLPSEDEWERAARHTDGRTYPWGNEKVQTGKTVRANVRFTRGRKPTQMTTAVGAFPDGAAPSGALDLAGNVWEWTSSRYLPYDGAPKGTPEDPRLYVFRGGGWTSASSLLIRGAMRVARDRDYRDAALGFRTVGEPPPKKTTEEKK